MKITLIEDKFPEMLPPSTDPIRGKIQINPLMDNPQLRVRRDLTWAWSEALAGRYVKHFTNFHKDPSVSLVDEETNTPMDLTLSWCKSDTSPLDDQFSDNWKRLMAWCYQSRCDVANLRVVYLGPQMPPSCNMYERRFSYKQLYNNWSKLTRSYGQDLGFKQSNKTFCKTHFSIIPDLLPMEGRSEGFHVSSAVTSLALDLGTIPGDSSGLTTTWAQIGCAWEDTVIAYLNRVSPGRYVVLPELELDGVFGTSDLYDSWDNVPIEIKMAWTGSRQPLTPTEIEIAWRGHRQIPLVGGGLKQKGNKRQVDKWFRYRCQLMSYCQMIESLVGRIIVCHVMGDWQTLTPRYRVWEFEFTQDELDDNWALVLMKRDKWNNSKEGNV